MSRKLEKKTEWFSILVEEILSPEKPQVLNTQPSHERIPGFTLVIEAVWVWF